MEMTTVLVMGDASRADYSTGAIIKGQVGPTGITLEELSYTSGLGAQGNVAPQIYAGTTIRDGEFSNEKIPRDAGSLIRPKVAAAKDAAPIDWSRYPTWYRSPPEKAGFMYASGEKKFQNQDTAFAMAEAAAAADIAVRLRARVTSRAAESSNTGTRLDSRIELEALENIPYRVVEKLYLEGAAFVLVELDLSSY
jgi:hypothetical protein